jgi:hypothetical protein
LAMLGRANVPAATKPKELRSNDRRVSLAIRFLPFLALRHCRRRLASLFPGAIYDDVLHLCSPPVDVGGIKRLT